MSIRHAGSLGPATLHTTFRPFLATDYGTCQVWLSAFSVGLTHAHNDAVTTWSDESGNGRNAVAGGTPSFKTDVFTTGGALRCEANSYFTVSAFSHAANWTIYLVVKRDAWTGTEAIVDGDDYPTNRVAQYFRANSSAAESLPFNTGGTPFTASASPGNPTDPHVFAIVRTDSLVTIYQDGVSLASTSCSGTAASGSARLTLNTFIYSAPAGSYGGSFGDFALMSGAADSTTRQTAERALGAQYGISVA